ncbi:MAG: DUF2939 domain-containing protein [Bauldia sp.]
MRRRLVLIALGVVVLGWAGWPYVSIYLFARALEARDAAGIDAAVDWPALRASLADELSAGLARNQQQNAILGAFGRPFIDAALQQYLTPAGIVSLLSGVRPGSGGNAAPAAPAGQGATAPASGGSSTQRFGLGNVRWAFFSGPISFRLDLASSEKSPVVTTHWTWSGSWRLSRIELPASATRR